MCLSGSRRNGLGFPRIHTFGRDTTTRRCEIIGLLKVGCSSPVLPLRRHVPNMQLRNRRAYEAFALRLRPILDARGVRNVAVRSAPRLPWKRLYLVEAYRPNAWPRAKLGCATGRSCAEQFLPAFASVNRGLRDEADASASSDFGAAVVICPSLTLKLAALARGGSP